MLAQVTTDIDGETRNATPDIGADEFTFCRLWRSADGRPYFPNEFK